MADTIDHVGPYSAEAAASYARAMVNRHELGDGLSNLARAYLDLKARLDAALAFVEKVRAFHNKAEMHREPISRTATRKALAELEGK